MNDKPLARDRVNGVEIVTSRLPSYLEYQGVTHQTVAYPYTNRGDETLALLFNCNDQWDATDEPQALANHERVRSALAEAE